MLAVVFGATMTSLSAEMSALATVTVVDIYQRHVRTDATDHQYLTASRVATVFWGVYAIVCAQFIKGMGSLVEAVNVLGSLFYGGMLGVFVLAFFFPRVTARGALYGVLVGQIVIFACWKYTGLAFLWYNVLGCVVVVLTGLALSAHGQSSESRPRALLPATVRALRLGGSNRLRRGRRADIGGDQLSVGTCSLSTERSR